MARKHTNFGRTVSTAKTKTRKVSASGRSNKKFKIGGGSHPARGARVSRDEDAFQSWINPFSVFPAEIWEMILNFVGCGCSSSSVQNVFLAYPELWDAFKTNIPLWLFDKAFPLILPYLSKQDVRRSTHVCKNWRRAIFNFAEEHPSLRPYNESAPTASTSTTQLTTSTTNLPNFLEVSFCDTRSIQRFLQINPNHESPFIGRYVSLNPLPELMNRGDFVEFKTCAKQLLESYGDQIWYFTIYSKRRLETAIEFFERLRLTLLLVPNLKSLHVVTQQDTRSKTLLAPRKRLPPLRHLESLTLEWPEIVPSLNIYMALLRHYANDQLRYLSLPLETWNEHVISLCNLSPEITFNGLTDVLLESDFGFGPINLDEINFGNFVSRLPIGGLQKLKIAKDFLGNPRVFFDHLYGFNIRVLDLQSSPFQLETFCNPRCESTGKCTTWERVSISLPNLLTLRIKYSLENSYKFLARIPALQTLELVSNASPFSQIPICYSEHTQENFHGCHYDEVTQELQKWIYLEPEMDKSLVWDLLVGLQNLQITFEFEKNGSSKVRVHMFRRTEFM